MLLVRTRSDAERLVRVREEDRILAYEVDKPSEDAVAHYGFLYHRIDGNLVGDPLLFTFDAKTTCRAWVSSRSCQ